MRMTRNLLTHVIAVFALGYAASAAHAEEAPTDDRESRRAAILEEFDIDSDGQLSREERGAARTARRENRRQGVLDRFDADGDGQLTGDERTAAREGRAARRAENGGEGGGRGMHGGGGRGGRSGGQRGSGQR